MEMIRDYPGAKGGAGVYQTIINNIPPHDVWIEAFVGSGQVTLHKRPAPSTIVIDADAAVIAHWKTHPGVTAICGDASSWLEKWPLNQTCCVYCDPPYLRSVRSCKRDYYRREFATEAEHESLLLALRKSNAKVMISGRPSTLYSTMLDYWRVVTYPTMDHRGHKVTECLWCNFPEPATLHDYRYVGSNYRERERIKRKKARWKARLLSMSILERAAILDAVGELNSP